MGLGKRSMALFEALLEAEVRALQATKEGEAKALALEVAVAEAQQEARETRCVRR